MSEFQIALDKIKKFQVIFASNFIAMRWEQRILEFIRVAFDLLAVSSLHRGSAAGIGLGASVRRRWLLNNLLNDRFCGCH